MKKIFLTILISIFLLSILSIGVVNGLDSLGTFKLNTCVDIKQTCSSCSYVNITISYPNSTIITQNKGMSSLGSGSWSYNFCNTSLNGRYSVIGEGDIQGTPTSFSAVYFDINPTGEETNENQGYIILGQLGIIALLFGIGLTFDKSKWKLRSGFFMFSLLISIITLNSIRILSGTSNSLNSMTNMGLILGIIILLFMFLFLLINYLIEVFFYFKKKNIRRWKVSEDI